MAGKWLHGIPRHERSYLRILHAPAAVAGNPQQLARSMRDDGHWVTTLVYEPNQYVSNTDVIVWSTPRGLVYRELRRLLAVLANVWQHDLYIFNYGSTISSPATEYSRSGVRSVVSVLLHSGWVHLLQIVELTILLARRVRVVVIFQGDDARQGDVQRQKFTNSIAHHVPQGYYTLAGDRRKRRLIARLRRFNTQLMALNPDLLCLLGPEAQFLPYSHIDLQQWAPTNLPSFEHGIIIGHFPSNPDVKGTPLIVEAVQSLQREGLPIKLELLTAVGQLEVRNTISKCHLVIDQLHAGFYGGVAVEAMALGRVTAAFIRWTDLVNLPKDFIQRLPVVDVTPQTIEKVLRSIVNWSPDKWNSAAKASRTFVEKWHDPTVVAQYLIDVARPLKLLFPTTTAPFEVEGQ